MYFDTHAHYDDEQFAPDREQVLASLEDSGVELVVDPGSDLPSSRTALELAESHPFIYAAVGVHPENAAGFSESDTAELEKLCASERVAAIGEIGLDYYYDHGPSREEQRRALYPQLELARSLGLPVIFHDREAHGDSLEAVRAFPGLRGVFHCFSGSLETALELLRLGWSISFTGAITFKNARRAPEIIAALPDDRIMIETDSPYMAPVPKRGTRNDSNNLIYICEALAGFRGISPERAAELTMKNGREFFNIRG